MKKKVFNRECIINGNTIHQVEIHGTTKGIANTLNRM